MYKNLQAWFIGKKSEIILGVARLFDDNGAPNQKKKLDTNWKKFEI